MMLSDLIRRTALLARRDVPNLPGRWAPSVSLLQEWWRRRIPPRPSASKWPYVTVTFL